MKTLTPKQIQAEIKHRNKVWKKAGTVQRRKLLAKDALAQIEAEKIKPLRGFWSKLPGDWECSDEQVQPALLSGIVCSACAAGSLMLAWVRYQNRCTGYDLHDENPFSSPEVSWKKMWPEANLALIEIAFEQSHGWNQEQEWKGGLKAADFGDRYQTNMSRLIAILKNIIKSKDGLFHP